MFAACAVRASAEDVTFVTVLRGEQRAAAVEIQTVDDIRYVSLVRILEQFGGGHSLLASRMRADFANMTAWVQYDDTRVNAMSLFSLRWKAIKLDDDVLIARDDVPLFFESAFRTEVTISNAPGLAPRLPGDPREVAMPVAESLGRISRDAAHAEPEAPADEPIRVLVIDAGHGGYDSGAELGPVLQEKNVTLAIALKVKALLEREARATIVATREADTDIGVKQRALLAANGEADFVVTIHVGASFSPASRGPALFYTPDAPSTAAKSPGRAEAMARAIAEKLAGPDSFPVRGIYEAPLRLPGLARMRGVLIEVGCITNEQDAQRFQTAEFADAIAADIASGISDYLASQPAPPPA